MNFNLQSKDLDPYFATNFDPLVSLLKCAAGKTVGAGLGTQADDCFPCAGDTITTFEKDLSIDGVHFEVKRGWAHRGTLGVKWTGSLLTERRMPNGGKTHVCTTPTPVVAAAVVSRSHTRALLRSSNPPAFAKSLRKATGLRPPCSGCLREETSRTSGRARTSRSSSGLGGSPPPQGGKISGLESPT